MDGSGRDLPKSENWRLKAPGPLTSRRGPPGKNLPLFIRLSMARSTSVDGRGQVSFQPSGGSRETGRKEVSTPADSDPRRLTLKLWAESGDLLSRCGGAGACVQLSASFPLSRITRRQHTGSRGRWRLIPRGLARGPLPRWGIIVGHVQDGCMSRLQVGGGSLSSTPDSRKKLGVCGEKTNAENPDAPERWQGQYRLAVHDGKCVGTARPGMSCCNRARGPSRFPGAQDLRWNTHDYNINGVSQQSKAAATVARGFIQRPSGCRWDEEWGAEPRRLGTWRSVRWRGRGGGGGSISAEGRKLRNEE